MNLPKLLPPYWATYLKNGPVCLGLDVASTIKQRSNPSALCIMEKVDNLFWQRLVSRWKVDDYKKQVAIIKYLLEFVPFGQRKYLVVDSSNEKFAANLLRDDLAGIIQVVGISGNQKVRYAGEEADAKTALGKAYSDALENGWIAMPSSKALANDHRLVTRNGSRFDADVDSQGNHADTFDGGKLAYWGHVGIAAAEPPPMGSWSHFTPNANYQPRPRQTWRGMRNR